MKILLRFWLSMAVFLCLALGVNAQSTYEEVYASDFDNEMTNGIPMGWVTYNEAGFHLYGFNSDGTQFNYDWGGNPGGGGARLYDGFSGDFTKALYWCTRDVSGAYVEFGSYVQEYMMEDGSVSPNMPKGIGLKLEPGEYHLQFQMAAWKGEPTFYVTVIDPDSSVCASFGEFVAAPDVNGTKGSVTGIATYDVTFSIDKAGYYRLRFDASEGTWQEYLLSNVKVYKGDAPAQQEEKQVHATFEYPSNTNTTWDSETQEFTWSTTYYNQLRNIGLPNGDLSKYKKLVVDCTMTEGDQFRILFYQGSTNRTLYAKDGVNEWNLVDALKEIAPDDWKSFLKDCTEICISGDNMSAPGSVIINDIYLETYPDGEEPYIPDMEEEEDPGRPDGDFVDLDRSLFNTMYPDYNVGYKQGMGDMIYGAMDQYAYADLSAYSKLTIVATPGLHLTLTFNHQFDFESKLLLEDYTEDEEGQYIWIDAVVGEDGIYELDLTQFYPVHLNYIRIPWRYNKQGAVWYMLLTEREFVIGDANGDGEVDVTDVVSIVNCILGQPSATFNAVAADVNGDGAVDVVDVVAVVNIILGKGNQAKARDMEVLSNALTMLSEKEGMNILVEGAAQFAAMQFDVAVSGNTTLLDATLNSSSDHKIRFAKIDENRYRVIAFSMDNESFEPTEDALIRLALNGTATIENATFVAADGRSMAMNITGDATGIKSVDSSKLTVENEVIYNVAGQRVSTAKKALPKGVYIRNGKRILVK